MWAWGSRYLNIWDKSEVESLIIITIHFLQEESSLLLNHTKPPSPAQMHHSVRGNKSTILWAEHCPAEKTRSSGRTGDTRSHHTKSSSGKSNLFMPHISVDTDKIITHFCCKTLFIECHTLLDLLYLIYYTYPHIVIIGLNNISCRLMWKSFLLNIKLLILILQGFVLSKLM